MNYGPRANTEMEFMSPTGKVTKRILVRDYLKERYEFFQLQMIVRKKYDRPESDPLSILQTYTDFIDLEATPPPDLQNWMAEKLRSYLDKGGENTLDEAFGLVVKEGARGVFDQSRKSIRISMMFKLLNRTNLRPSEASRLVANREREYEFGEPRADSIERDFRNARKNNKFYSEENQNKKEQIESLHGVATQEEDLQYLKTFDVSYIAGDTQTEKAIKKLQTAIEQKKAD